MLAKSQERTFGKTRPMEETKSSTALDSVAEIPGQSFYGAIFTLAYFQLDSTSASCLPRIKFQREKE